MSEHSQSEPSFPDEYGVALLNCCCRTITTGACIIHDEDGPGFLTVGAALNGLPDDFQLYRPGRRMPINKFERLSGVVLPNQRFDNIDYIYLLGSAPFCFANGTFLVPLFLRYDTVEARLAGDADENHTTTTTSEQLGVPKVAIMRQCHIQGNLHALRLDEFLIQETSKSLNVDMFLKPQFKRQLVVRPCFASLVTTDALFTGCQLPRCIAVYHGIQNILSFIFQGKNCEKNSNETVFQLHHDLTSAKDCCEGIRSSSEEYAFCTVHQLELFEVADYSTQRVRTLVCMLYDTGLSHPVQPRSHPNRRLYLAQVSSTEEGDLALAEIEPPFKGAASNDIPLKMQCIPSRNEIVIVYQKHLEVLNVLTSQLTEFPLPSALTQWVEICSIVLISDTTVMVSGFILDVLWTKFWLVNVELLGKQADYFKLEDGPGVCGPTTRVSILVHLKDNPWHYRQDTTTYSGAGAGVLYMASTEDATEDFWTLPEEFIDFGAPKPRKRISNASEEDVLSLYHPHPPYFPPPRHATLIPDPYGTRNKKLLAVGGGSLGYLTFGCLSDELVTYSIAEGTGAPGVHLIHLSRHILLSSKDQNVTVVLDVDKNDDTLSLKPGCVPGLILDTATVGCVELSMGKVLQVTAQGVYVFKLGGKLIENWNVPVCSIQQMCVSLPWVAVSTLTAVYVLSVCDDRGSVKVEASYTFMDQPSSVAFFRKRDVFQLAVSFWASSEITLLEPGKASVRSDSLSAGDWHVRSLYGMGDTLFAGTSTGQVVVWSYPRDKDNDEHYAYWEAGVAPVTEFTYIKACCCLIALSDQAVIIHASESGGIITPNCLHGSVGVASICSTGDGVAWVDVSGQLHLGNIIINNNNNWFNWDRLTMDGKPVKVVYDPDFAVAVVLMEDGHLTWVNMKTLDILPAIRHWHESFPKLGVIAQRVTSGDHYDLCKWTKGGCVVTSEQASTSIITYAVIEDGHGGKCVEVEERRIPHSAHSQSGMLEEEEVVSMAAYVSHGLDVLVVGSDSGIRLLTMDEEHGFKSVDNELPPGSELPEEKRFTEGRDDLPVAIIPIGEAVWVQGVAEYVAVYRRLEWTDSRSVSHGLRLQNVFRDYSSFDVMNPVREDYATCADGRILSEYCLPKDEGGVLRHKDLAKCFGKVIFLANNTIGLEQRYFEELDVESDEMIREQLIVCTSQGLIQTCMREWLLGPPVPSPSGH